jgi:hypothetical protein
VSETEREKFGIIAILVSATTYLVLVAIAAVVSGHPVALRLAIATAGVNYFGYLVQMQPRVYFPLARVLVVLSVVCGAAAGLNLLW